MASRPVECHDASARHRLPGTASPGTQSKGKKTALLNLVWVVEEAQS
jgi:hypothetical protein